MQSENSEGKRTLGVFAVILIVYFNVSGGPLGSETIFSACGPLIGLISLFVSVVVWCVQQSLVTLELSSAFPENGGYSLWVQRAFGTFWGVQESYYSWVSGVIDNALYPGLIYNSAKHLFSFIGNETLSGETSYWDSQDAESEGAGIFFPGFFSIQGVTQFTMRAGLCVLMVVPNLMCIKGFGWMLSVLGSIALVPFIIFVAMGLGQIQPSNLIAYNVTSGGFDDLVQVVFWNVNGFDCISTATGEVQRPARTIGIGLLVAGSMMVLTYLLPLLVSAGVNRPRWQEGWDDGYYSVFAYEIGGLWLSAAIVVASMVGGIGLYVTELFEDSFQLQGMAEDGMAPSCLRCRHKRCRTPVNAIVLNLIIILVLQALDVDTILTYTNVISCASCLLEMAAVVWLRVKRPDLPRPFRIPLNTWQLVVLLSPSIVLALYIIVSGMMGSWLLFGANVGALVFGVVPYGLLVYSKSRTKRKQEKTTSFSDAILHTQNNTHPMADSAVEEIPFLGASDNTADGFVTQDMAVINGDDDADNNEGAMVT